MDPNGHIYEGTVEKPVTLEDAARLDGFLRGRAEADELMKDIKRAAYEAKVREMEEREGR